MQVLIFGTGKYYQKYKKFFFEHEIVGFLDNDPLQQGTCLDGVHIFSPKAGLKMHYDCIYVLMPNTQSVIKQLLDYGVAKTYIRGVSDLLSLKPCLSSPCIYSSTPLSEHGNKHVLLISHDLSYTGAPLALAALGRILFIKGYQVSFASPTDNRQFRQSLVQEGMSVIIDETLRCGRLRDFPWVRGFDFIGVNTVVLCPLLAEWTGDCPVFWWIHEVREAYKAIDILTLKSLGENARRIFPYAVSFRAKRYFLEQYQQGGVNELLYGLPDDTLPCKPEGDAKVVFALIGTVAYRKGLDLFLDAITLFLHRGHTDVLFWIIGDYENTAWGRDIYRKASTIPQVVFWGGLPHEEVVKLFPRITAVVVPSRDETMSIAANEAMMHSVGCIVSEDTGVAPYVEKEHAGIVCPTEDTDCWVTAMEWVIKNPKQWEEFGVHGRATYEKYFSMKVFEKNVDKMLRKIRQ